MHFAFALHCRPQAQASLEKPFRTQPGFIINLRREEECMLQQRYAIAFPDHEPLPPKEGSKVKKPLLLLDSAGFAA